MYNVHISNLRTLLLIHTYEHNPCNARGGDYNVYSTFNKDMNYGRAREQLKLMHVPVQVLYGERCQHK